MCAGSVWLVLKQAERAAAEAMLPGALPLERSTVCANTGFVLNRNNEFMFLMLGETVLQIIVAVAPGEVADVGSNPFFNAQSATAASGFTLAASMMFSFRSMVRGQLQNYERTNHGLEVRAIETEQLINTVAETQAGQHAHVFGRRIEASSSTCGAADVGAADGGAADVGTAEGGAADVVKADGVGLGVTEAPRGGRKCSALVKRMIDSTALEEGFELVAERMLIQMKLYNLLNSLLWEGMALSVMLVGIGVKLAIYAPMASPSAHYAFEQRVEIGVPLGVCFFLQIFHSVLVKHRHHYSARGLIEQPAHLLVLLVRLLLLTGCPLVCLLPLPPLYVTLVLAALSVAQCAMLQLHEFKYNIRSARPHPMHKLPNALLALQHKRKREASKAASAHGAQEQLQTIRPREAQPQCTDMEAGLYGARKGRRGPPIVV